MSPDPAAEVGSTPLSRGEFPVCQRWSYLNNAGVNALPRAVVEAMTCWAQRAAEEGAFAGDPEAEMDEARRRGAALLGVGADEVALVKNTTEGLAFVASGLSWCPGDRVVVPEHEFPSNFYPWTALADQGVAVDTIATRGEGETLPVAAVAEACGKGPPPKLVALSWVQFGRGWRSDLGAVAEVAHAAGALLCVDVIQGAGVIPAELGTWGVDFAAADAHKWLLGPPGIGLLYVREGLLGLLRPAEPGWASVQHREDYDNLELVWDPTARRFEGGTANLPGVAGLNAALRLLGEAGVERIWEHVDNLCRLLVQGLEDADARVLSDRSPGGGSGIVSFSVAGHDPVEITERLKARGIATAARAGGVRVSPHGFNLAQEMEAVVAEVKALS